MTPSNRPVGVKIAVTGSSRDAEYQPEMTWAVARPAMPALHSVRYSVRYYSQDKDSQLGPISNFLLASLGASEGGHFGCGVCAADVQVTHTYKE